MNQYDHLQPGNTESIKSDLSAEIASLARTGLVAPIYEVTVRTDTADTPEDILENNSNTSGLSKKNVQPRLCAVAIEIRKAATFGHRDFDFVVICVDGSIVCVRKEYDVAGGDLRVSSKRMEIMAPNSTDPSYTIARRIVANLKDSCRVLVYSEEDPVAAETKLAEAFSELKLAMQNREANLMRSRGSIQRNINALLSGT